ncbi:MAG: hypothetical protein COB51_10185 [Moraxellaceae bacterium]|nr:MAG: hypothetical protein COB51_10185 [Moraxellaceae bacterium]
MKTSLLTVSNNQEKRRYKRHSPGLPLRVFDRGTGLGIGPLANISLDGLKVYCAHDYDPGAVIVFAMVLPVRINGSRNVSFEGRCAWSLQSEKEEFEAGFEITQISASNKTILKLLTTKFC